jgi:hypothetical protein
MHWLRKVALCLPLFGMLLSEGYAQVSTPPVITAQPLDVSVRVGDTATLSVVALSGTTLSYQWRKDGNEINGAKHSTHKINKVKSADGGRYSVEVENAAGTVVSSTAVLGVISTNVPLSFTALQMATNGFRMRLSGPVASDYVIWASSDFTKWIPISTNPAPNGTVDFTDTSARNHSARFYRAMVR